MECYTTPWQLLRECRNFFIEPSFTLGAPLSLLFVAISLTPSTQAPPALHDTAAIPLRKTDVRPNISLQG